ncbi:MAG: hypothetical protein M3Y30_09440 [Gemmatimonadota bacterium]|nr:hypothetical protein [Gemmatimonadota bacterium]
MSPKSVTVSLDDKRQKLGVWWQKLQHVIGGVPLLLAGVRRLETPGDSAHWLAIVEIAFALLLLALFVRDVRAEAAARMRNRALAEPYTTPHTHNGPEWFDVVAGTLILIEAVLSTQAGGKPLYQRALFYLGLATLVTGLAHGLLANLRWKRRFVRVDDSGLHVRLSRFTKFDVEWTDVIDIRLGERNAIVVAKTGSHTIPLNRYLNARDITTALADWRDRHALARSL